nr:DUF2303 family protein [Phytoactinopolyspora alkaliphila]
MARQVAHGDEIDPGEVRVAFGSDNQFHLVDAEKHGTVPRRSRGTVVLHDVASFTRYLDEMAGSDIDDVIRVYADSQTQKIVAVIGDDTAGTPSWRDYRAELRLRETEPWKRWTSNSGKLMPQVAFAEHIKDSLADLIEPSGAAMYDVAESLEVSKSGEFKSAQRLHSGEITFTYAETHQARAGHAGELEVPRNFTLSLVPWHGLDPSPVFAELRYRIDGGLLIGYKLLELDRVIETAFAMITDQITCEGHNVYAGVAPAALA